MAIAQQTFAELHALGLADIDPEIADLLGREADRQRGQIELIASENFTWPSILEAVGLPGLVTTSLADYEALALKLARDKAALALLRDKLARNRTTQPLFDNARLCRAMEAAYRQMLKDKLG